LDEQSGPAKKQSANHTSNGTTKSKKTTAPLVEEESDSDLGSEESVSEDGESDGSESEEVSDEEEASTNGVAIESEAVPADRKRKRRRDEDDIEGQYMERIAREEAKEDAKLREERKIKRQKASSDSEGEPNEDKSEDEGEDEDSEAEDGAAEPAFEIPQHEALAGPEGSAEFEKANRTVFLGNVSSTAMTSKSAKKTLLRHLALFLPSLPAHAPPHTLESIRFRSTAYSNKIPKKAAFAKKELMEATTKSTNAYAVYSTKIAAREAARVLNGTVVLDRHLRVDEVAHPAKTDARRCVFVGNLGFVDDESAIQADNAELSGRKPRKTIPGDVEEGLWREFGKVGTVESVRVVRDPKTRVGKGFAYVQFKVHIQLPQPSIRHLY
jgi:nucleolar protein 12